MEFVPGGDLGKLIADQGAFNETEGKTLTMQLLSALDYLHSNNITHRDVKPDNILINSYEPLDVKLTDFGLSKIVDSEQTFLRTFCGTLLYCAPEVYTEYPEYDDNGVRSRDGRKRRTPGQRYSHAVDIWSLGGVLFYCLTTAPPYPVKGGISHSELLQMIMSRRLNVTPLQQQRVSDTGIDFLSRMLQRRPEHRATIAELDVHPWLGGSGSVVASQSYDEITDDEDLEPGMQVSEFEADHVSDSEKENDDYGQARQHQSPPQRLFGEVGVSAIGSSGVIPDDFLNLPVQSDSMKEGTVILGSPRDQAYDSVDSTAAAVTRIQHRAERQGTVSMIHEQSADQLQSLVENVASQSLGGDSPKEPLASSRYSSMDFNTSKRKPPSHDTSDEFDENTPPTKPLMKRLKSEGNIEEVSEAAIEECKLLAGVPPIRRLDSGRQIDKPVSKVTYWEQDKVTWHLNYPEMTQLQYDVFAEAARSRREDFVPGKTPLWDLAMKYFSPIHRLSTRSSRASTRPRGLPRDESTLDAMMDFPPTAMPALDPEELPDSPSIPDTQIVVPIQLNAEAPRAVGLIESRSVSCVQGISFPITDKFVSFGRALDNTESFEPKSEPKVPKHAFKIMLWKEGPETRESSKTPPPWLRETGEDQESYSFWISTKATLGIRINEHSLPSSDAKNPHGPSRHWTRIYDGDDLIIWGGADPRNQTLLTFRCFWSASQHPRLDKTLAPEMASEELAERLDAACSKIEKKLRDTSERRRRVSEAENDFRERNQMVDQERERSRLFEARRVEAVEYLQARHAVVSRRYSPASVI